MKLTVKRLLSLMLAATAAASLLALPVSADWKEHNGNWQYYDYDDDDDNDDDDNDDDDDDFYENGFKKINNKWYFFDGQGYMKTGWIRRDGDWFYMGTDGAMKTGWIKDGSNWFYCDSDGEMQTGWETILGKKYFFDNSGKMATGEKVINGTKFVFNKDGSLQDVPVDYGDAGEVFDAMNRAVCAAHTDIDSLMGMGTQELTSDLLKEIYSFPVDAIDSMKGYNSAISPKRGMMLVVEAKDGKVKEVKAAMEKILKQEKDSAWYGNEQELAKAAKIFVDDDIVALVEIGVSEGQTTDCAADVKIAEKAFKKAVD